jgi:hypothetical protein
MGEVHSLSVAAKGDPFLEEENMFLSSHGPQRLHSCGVVVPARIPSKNSTGGQPGSLILVRTLMLGLGGRHRRSIALRDYSQISLACERDQSDPCDDREARK